MQSSITLAAGLLVESDYVARGIAKARGDFRRVRADRLHELAAGSDDAVYRRCHAVVLPVEQVNWRNCCDRRDRLQRQHRQRRSWTLRQPADREEPNDRNLCRHQQLPKMRRRPFVRLTRRAGDEDVNKNNAERGQRHRDRNKSTRPLDHCSQVHFVSSIHQPLTRKRSDTADESGFCFLFILHNSSFNLCPPSGFRASRKS